MSDIKTAIQVVVPELVAGSHTAFFNPADYAADVLTENKLRFQLMSNHVWALDSSIVNVSTDLYYQVARENPEVASDIGSLIEVFRGSYDHEGFWGEGPARRLVQLVSLQSEWHDLAHRFAFADGRDSYKPKSIDELAASVSPMKLTAQQLANLGEAAKVIADTGDVDQSDGVTPEEIQATLVRQAIERNKRSADMRRKLLPAITNFYREAKLVAEAGEPIRFDELSTTHRMFIMRTALNAIPRILTDLARLDSSTYMMVLIEARSARKTYARVVDKLAEMLANERTGG